MLQDLVGAGLAIAQRDAVGLSKTKVPHLRIRAGRRSRNKPQLTRSNCHAWIHGVMKSPKRARTQHCDPQGGVGRISMSMTTPNGTERTAG
jgi:hypothetical protein